MSRRLLTFNWHESFLHLLATIGYQWDVVPRLKGGRSDWMLEVRPVPPNMRIVTAGEAAATLDRDGYDAAICHNMHDLHAVIASGVPTVTVFHTSRVLERAFGLRDDRWQAVAEPLLARSTRVYVSQSKSESWGGGGLVIPPGIDGSLYGGYAGDDVRVLNIGNLKAELAAVNGFDILQQVTAGLPLTLKGLNPHIRGSQLSRNWDDMRETLRHHRVYLNTTRAPYEDGYNLAMLEAMATGMPVVSLANPSCPIVDGRTGYAGDDAATLRVRVLELLEDIERARALGDAGREDVLTRFPIARFHERWRHLIEDVIAGTALRASA